MIPKALRKCRTWLKLNWKFTARLDLKSEFLESIHLSRLWTPVLLINPSTPSEPQYPHTHRHSCLPHAREFPSLAPCHLFLCSALDEKKKNHVTLPHVLTPFCHSCLHAGEICFWLGEDNLQTANPEMVVTRAGVMHLTRLKGEKLFSGEVHIFWGLCTEKGHLVFYASFPKVIL